MRKFLILALIFSSTVAAFAQNRNAEQETEVVMKTAPSHQVKSKEDLRVSFALHYSTAKDLSFKDATARSTSGRSFKGTTNFDIESNIGFAIGFQKIPYEGLGYSSFLSYEKGLKLTGYNDAYAGQKTSGDLENEPELNLANLEGNAIWSIGKVYFPFGLNWTFPEFKSDYSKSSTVTGAMGYQLGIGIAALDNLAIDVLYKVRNIELEETFTKSKYNYGSGSIAGAHLQTRFLF